MKNSIKRQLSALIIGMAIIPITLSSVLLGWQSYQNQVENSIAYQSEISHRASNEILNFIHTAIDHLSLFSKLFDSTVMKPVELEDAISMMLSHRDETHFQMFQDIAVFDANAEPLACVSKSKVCDDEYMSTVFIKETVKRSIESGHEVFNSIVFDSEKGLPTILLAIPVFNPVQTKPQGCIAANIRLKELRKSLNELGQKSGVSAYLIDVQGRPVAHENPSVILRQTILSEPQKEGVRKGLNDEWVVTVNNSISIGDKNFSVIIERPLLDSLAFTIQALIGLCVAIIITLIFSLYIAIHLIQRIASPIDMLTTKARQISKGDFTQRVELQRDDELGELAEAFNMMSLSIEEHIQSLDLSIEEKRKINKALSESLSELEELTYVSTHHLQEPVRVMYNYSEMLVTKCLSQLDDPGKRYLSFIQQKSTMMQKMLQDIMEFLSLNRAEVRKEAVNIELVVNDAEKIVFHQKLNKTAVIKKVDLPIIKTDRRLLGKVFVHLLDNAFKFNDNPKPCAEITAEPDSDGWCITVIDNGIGIDAKYVDKAFKLFGRLHNQDDYLGTGIGLANCRKIISLLGGKWIRLEPIETSGTRVVFHLPD